jgi:CubicO group peptidase (beta-lactamase class C family)
VEAALDAGEALNYLRSLLVVRNGVLIGERYYGGFGPTYATNAASVSKSILSALVGIAERDGYLDIDQPILDFFPDYAEGLEARKSDITIRHLLTMTAGYPTDDYGVEWGRWLASPDWVGHCLRQPLEDDPGDAWYYSTCSTHIGSALLTRATGMSARDFAEEHLFEPMEIELGGWRQDPHGYYRGGWDMFFTPRDLARFGHLYLKEGKLGGERIVPKKWVRKTTQRNVKASGNFAPTRWGYGHWWWTINEPFIDKMYFALGYGGQFVINIPKLEMTIVATAKEGVSPAVGGKHINAILELIIESILVPMKTGG